MKQMQEIYHKQVQLLIETLPYIATEDQFALKGGTAINLFMRDMPRLSVDIDLIYLPFDSREVALKNIRAALSRIEQRLCANNIRVRWSRSDKQELRLIVMRHDVQIKIEISPVSRGTLYAAIPNVDITESANNEFSFASIAVVAPGDLYGSKLCAALDRQHPRDLFDMLLLLNDDGFTREIFNGFIAYLLGHPRPIHEVLAPIWRNIKQDYINEFAGMTKLDMSVDSLTEMPERIHQALKAQFTPSDAEFLLSFKQKQPNWSLFPEPKIQALPAVKWKLENIKKINEAKHAQAVRQLEKVLNTFLS